MKRLTILLAAMAALMLVPAAQAFAEINTKINIVGSGSGEVISTGSGEFNEFEANPPLSCSYNGASTSGVCETESLETEEESGYYSIALQALPAMGSELGTSGFGGWTVNKGEKVFGFGTCPVSKTEHFCYIASGNEEEELELTIEFTKEAGPEGPPLHVAIEEGQGTVVSNPAGIECTGAAPHECTTEEIAEGETVTLTASPAAGYQFKSWKYCDSGGVHGRQCTITLTENHKPVGAKFAAANDVSVEKTGNGTGSITGVTCGNTCTAATGSIVASKTVTLKAKPYAKNSEFLGWSASPVSCTLSEEGKTCSLGILAANETVEAEFAEIARENLTLTKSGSGSGSVKSAPAGINCSYTCGSNTAYFYKGTSVTLTAAVQVGKGSALGNWGGACSGSEATPCVVSMNEAKSVTAEFK